VAPATAVRTSSFTRASGKRTSCSAPAVTPSQRTRPVPGTDNPSRNHDKAGSRPGPQRKVSQLFNDHPPGKSAYT